MARIPKQVADYTAEIGSRGGKKRVPKGFAKLTDEQRKEMPKRSAEKRWEKKVGKIKAKARTKTKTRGRNKAA